MIREATIDDFEQLIKLKIASKQEERRWNKELKPVDKVKNHYEEYLKNDLKSKWRKVFIALEKDKIIGLITCRTYRSLRIAGYQRFGYISNLYIKKNYRKKGTAKKLIDYAMKWFKKRKATKVTLEIYQKNLAAINLYHKIGFKNYSIKMRKRI